MVERECDRHLCVFAELKELTNSLTTEELVSEIRELKAECSGYRARLETIKSTTNHVTPEEREKVGDIYNQAAILQTCSLLFCSIWKTSNILIFRCTKSGRYM